MKNFTTYIKDININISKNSDVEAEKFLNDNGMLDEVHHIIDDLNKQLNLSKNKKKFNISLSKEVPFLKNKDQNKVVLEWLNSNEKLHKIKRNFISYLTDLQF